VSEGAQNLQQQIMQSVRDYFGASLGGAKAQLQDARTQLGSLAEQTPQEEAQAEIQEMVDSYYEIESRIDQAAQDHGVEDAVNQATQQTDGQVTEQAGQAVQGAQDAAGDVAGQAGQVAQQAQDTAGQAAGQAQETVGGAAQQAQEAAGQTTDQAQGAVGQVAGQAGQAAQGVQDTAGQATQQAQQAAGGQQQGGQQQPNATQAAAQKAEELGVDLSQVEGSGSGGRITVKDVTSAASQG
jgi:hypothetical protein